MKRLAISLIVLGLTIAAANSAKASTLGRQLVELESHIQWSAVDNAWKNLRPDWVRTTSRCDEAACVAAQLLKLEQNVMESGRQGLERSPSRLDQRLPRRATTERAVAGLLLEFESNVRWRAVDEAWKQRRESWVSELKSE